MRRILPQEIQVKRKLDIEYFIFEVGNENFFIVEIWRDFWKLFNYNSNKIKGIHNKWISDFNCYMPKETITCMPLDIFPCMKIGNNKWTSEQFQGRMDKNSCLHFFLWAQWTLIGSKKIITIDTVSDVFYWLNSFLPTAMGLGWIWRRSNERGMDDSASQIPQIALQNFLFNL